MDKTLAAITNAIKDCNCLEILSHFKEDKRIKAQKMKIDSGNLGGRYHLREIIEDAFDKEKYRVEILLGKNVFEYELRVYHNNA